MSIAVETGEILIIEDDEGIRNALIDLLGMESLNGVGVADGLAALAWIGEHKPSLAILDINLPKLSGKAVGAAIRSRWADVPILCITADGHAKRKGAEAMANESLTKPFNIADFFDAVYRLLP